MKKISLVIAGFALILAVIAIGIVFTTDRGKIDLGAPGAQLAEDYIPEIMYNDGYNSNKGITLNTSSGDLSVAGDTTLSGTSTITLGYDGFVANANFTLSTGTAKAVYTNNKGVNMLCQGGAIIADSLSTTLGPTLVVSLGTSSSATGYSTNLLASSTIATTTDETDPLANIGAWRLASGESIVGALSDNVTNASSTYYTSSYWNIDFGIPCWIVD